MNDQKDVLFHCSNCREDYKEEGVKTLPLDYVQDPTTGKPVAAKNRVSIFCKKCDHFIGIADPQRDKTLEEFKKKPITQTSAAQIPPAQIPPVPPVV